MSIKIKSQFQDSLPESPADESDSPQSLIQTEFLKMVKALEILSSRPPSADPNNFSEKKIKEILNKECADESIRKRLREEFLGQGPLVSLTADPDITEIIIDGEKNILFEKEGRLYPHNDFFLSKWTFENFVHRISSKTPPNLKTPYSDGKWLNFRVHIVTHPLTTRSFHITLRKHPKESWTFHSLQNKNWAPKTAIDLLQQMIQKKMNILIAGSTSSGKTSVLNACLNTFGSRERAVIIEDTDELACPNPCSVKLLTRLSSPHLPAIDQSILVQQSLRMRPDRIVMGEVRGTEAKDLIMALATGHEGSMGTIHAHHHKQALLRLELLVQSGNPTWSSLAIRSLIHLSIQIIVIVKKEQGERKLQGIYHITGLEKTGFLFDTLFQKKTQLPQSRLTHFRGGIGH